MDKWARAIQAAESVLEDNLTDVHRITVWVTGSKDGKESYLMCTRVDADGDTVKSRFEIPQWIMDECDTEKHMMRYAVEAITMHLMLEKYDEKFD